MLDVIAIGLIDLYRAHLSQMKRYGCAYRLLAGGRSCSLHAQVAIRRAGLVGGLRLLSRRLQACRRVALLAQSDGPSEFEQRHFGQCALAVHEGRKYCCGCFWGSLAELGDGGGGGGSGGHSTGDKPPKASAKVKEGDLLK